MLCFGKLPGAAIALGSHVRTDTSYEVVPHMSGQWTVDSGQWTWSTCMLLHLHYFQKGAWAMFGCMAAINYKLMLYS